MFGLFTPRVETLVACEGRVVCPSRGVDTDIDLCVDCPRLTEILQEHETTFIRCTPLPQKRFARASWNLIPS